MLLQALESIAMACSCVDVEYPARGLVGTNAEFFVQYDADERTVGSVALIDSEDAEVDIVLSEEPYGGLKLLRLSPSEPLLPGGEYTVLPDDGAYFSQSYTASSAPDATPPMEVDVVARLVQRPDDSTCGDQHHYSVRVVTDEEEPAVYEVQWSMSQRFERADHVVTTTPNTCFGTTYCCYAQPDSLALGPLYHWRARAIDLAGNPGAWSEPARTEVVSTGCACNTAAGSLHPAFAVGTAALLTWRRRHRGARSLAAR